MKRVLLCGCLLPSMFLLCVSYAAAQALGSSPASPAPAGKTLAGIVECGQGYTSHELYDMKITLIEVLRGEEAWKRIAQASSSNKPAPAGSDYVLAKVRFEYKARGTPGLCVHQLVPDQFTACSQEGVDYQAASVAGLQPEMRKDMKSGEAFEGWLAFVVPRQDKAPLMSYSADKGGAIVHGGSKWFVLQ
jgi:hypothetical protein